MTPSDRYRAGSPVEDAPEPEFRKWPGWAAVLIVVAVASGFFWCVWRAVLAFLEMI